MLIERRLKKEGHEVVVVQHGGMAVRAMEEDPAFDIILMDLNMPIMGGLEASTKIRQIEPSFSFSSTRPRTHTLNGRIPILAVTANSHERGRSDLVDAGLGECDLLNARREVDGAPVGHQPGTSCSRPRSDSPPRPTDGWCLKPIRFARLFELMAGAVDVKQRQRDVYQCVCCPLLPFKLSLTIISFLSFADRENGSAVDGSEEHPRCRRRARIKTRY